MNPGIGLSVAKVFEKKETNKCNKAMCHQKRKNVIKKWKEKTCAEDESKPAMGVGNLNLLLILNAII